MSTIEKMLLMFQECNPECDMNRIQAVELDDGSYHLNYVKNDQVCWSKSREDILFDYMTRDMENNSGL